MMIFVCCLFDCTLRFSDFHVNEIDLNGKIVQLTDLSPPIESMAIIDYWLSFILILQNYI